MVLVFFKCVWYVCVHMFMYVMYVHVWACVWRPEVGITMTLLYVLKPGLLGNSGLPNGASLAVQLISGIPASASRILGVHGCWKF